MLEIRQYIPSDLALINGWLAKQGVSETSSAELPEIGRVALFAKKPAAAIFLRRAEGNLGLIDGLCASPEIRRAERHHIIDSLVEALIQEARKLKLAALMFFSRSGSVFTRAERFGFRDPGFKVMRLNFSGEN